MVWARAMTLPPPDPYSTSVGSPVEVLVAMIVASPGRFSNTVWLAEVPVNGSGTPAISGWSGAATLFASSNKPPPTLAPPGSGAPLKSPKFQPWDAASTTRRPPPLTYASNLAKLST
jgi:hypothetical protein